MQDTNLPLPLPVLKSNGITDEYVVKYEHSDANLKRQSFTKDIKIGDFIAGRCCLLHG